jgi:hypothetical protein
LHALVAGRLNSVFLLQGLDIIPFGGSNVPHQNIVFEYPAPQPVECSGQWNVRSVLRPICHGRQRHFFGLTVLLKFSLDNHPSE